MANVNEINNSVILPTPTENDFIRMDPMSFNDWCAANNLNKSELKYGHDGDKTVVLNNEGKQVAVLGDIEGTKPLMAFRSKYDPNGAYMKAIKDSGDLEHLQNAENKVFTLIMRSKYGVEVAGNLSDLLGD